MLKSCIFDRNPYTNPSRIVKHAQASVQRRHTSYNAKTFIPNPRSPNHGLVQHLVHEVEMAAQSVPSEVFRVRALQRAAKIIDQLPESVVSGQEAMKLEGIGEGIARRIDEFLTPENKKKGKQKASDPEREDALSEIKKVPGIGPVKAQKLYEAGCCSLADLRKPEYFKLLSPPVQTALEYVEHMSKQATRSQVEDILDATKAVVSADVRLHAVGNYRRGLSLSPSVEIIIFHPSCVYVPRPGEKYSSEVASPLTTKKARGRPRKHVTNSRMKQDTLLREHVLSPLERAGVIASTLSEGPRRWQGIVRIPHKDEGINKRILSIREREGLFRKVDIILYPALSEGAALLMSTGDSEFSAYLCDTAQGMGLQLNEFGLWRFKYPKAAAESKDSESQQTEEGRWELVASVSEEEIFSELGESYIAPEKRNFKYIMRRPRSKPKSRDGLLAT